VKSGIQEESGDRQRRKVSAGGGLNGVCGERVVSDGSREFAFLPGEQWHHQQRRESDGNSERACLGLKFAQQARAEVRATPAARTKRSKPEARLMPRWLKWKRGVRLRMTSAAESSSTKLSKPNASKERNGALDQHPPESDCLEKDELATR
jgi:hypothetical protein